MVSEDVVVRVYTDSIVTVGSFSMHNEGETVSMEVGFPFLRKNDVVSFRAYIDGQPVEVRDAHDNRSSPDGRKKWTTHWKLWATTFLESDSCTIRVEYQTRPLEHSLFREKEFEPLPAATVDSLRRATTECTVEYMLATGRSWKGVLDRCTVSFEFMDITSGHIAHYSPEDGVVKENRVIWEYADYEPRSGLILSYNPCMPVEDIPEVFRRIAEQRSKDPSLVRAAGHYCGVWGRTDIEFEIYHSFLAKWDEPIPQLMEYASGGRCRYNFKADHHFYSIWLMARVLFTRHRKLGTIEECRDIAPTVSRISSAIVDSLDTCGGLPASSEGLLRDAKDLLSVSKGLMNATVER